MNVIELLFDILHACDDVNHEEAKSIIENCLSALNNLAIQQLNRKIIHDLGGKIYNSC
jgi:hypothetical protein